MGRGSTGSPTTGRKLILKERSIHRGVEGGYEELNVPTKPKQR
jgi:hypothetical protein